MLPQWIDCAEAESTSTSLVRGLRGLTGRWGELVAVAQAVVSHYQELPRETSDRLYEEEDRIPLVAAARILDSASQTQSNLAEEDRQSLGLVAAAAFGMWGNFPSAAAVVRRTFGDLLGLPEELIAVVALNAPRLLPELLGTMVEQSAGRVLLEKLSYFLATGDASKTDELQEALIDCILQAPTPLASSLLRSSRISLSHVLRLNVAKVLREACPKLPEDYRENLQTAGLTVFLPPQYKAVVTRQLVTRSDNALVGMPTGTGKTFLAELCVVNSLSDGPGLACYIVPWIALGRQVAARFEKHLPKSFRVHALLGGYRDTEPVSPDVRREVVVATPERFDVLLRTSPEVPHHLRCVVLDEAHMVQNDDRGARTEGILTRLRLLQKQGYGFRIVLVSAVLPEAQIEGLARWLAAPRDCVFVDNWKPTARRLACWLQDGRLVWFVGDDVVRRESVAPHATLGEIILPWPEPNLYAHDQIGILLHELPLAARNIAYVCDRVHTEYGEPILCVCGTRAGTRLLAGEVAERFTALEPLPPEIKRVTSLINKRYSYLKPLGQRLSRGVAFHNSSLPIEVREGIEEAASRKELRVVCSTTTLAEGVDLPFRFTIVVDWISWGADQPISSLLFRNISGRCGRAGQYTEGDTVLFDNPIGPTRLAAPYIRSGLQRDLMFDRQTRISPSALSRLGVDRSLISDRIRAALASQFMAAIPENPNEEDLASSFSDSTLYAFTSGSPLTVQKELMAVRKSLLAGVPLAVAASPLSLTDIGNAANLTGFSPDSCRKILLSLHSLDVEPEMRVVSLTLLRQLAGLPEQKQTVLLEIISGLANRSAVKKE